MRTSCPECKTTFRVSQDHLGLRRGLVRCGHCNAVFNAYDTLLPDLVEPPPMPQEDQPIPELEHTPKPITTPATTPRLASLDEAPAPAQPALLHEIERVVAEELNRPRIPKDAIPRETAKRPKPDPEPPLSLTEPEASLHMQDEPVPDTPIQSLDLYAEVAASEDTSESSDDILLSALPSSEDRRAARRAALKKAMQVLVIALLGFGLVAQITYFARGKLAATLPGLRPALVALCDSLGCDIPLPRQITRQAIVSSTLEHDPEQKSRIRLVVLLANRTGQVQAWPHLVLTLSDERESPVAQRSFAPETYLPKTLRPETGFPVRQEQEIRLDLDIGNLAAASYVLGIAYPD